MPDILRGAVVLVVCWLVAGSASAQSLSAAYQAALGHDPDWLGAREDAAAASEGDAQARSLFRPKLGVSAGVSYSRTTTNVTLPPPVEDIDKLRSSGFNVNAGVNVEQPLLNGQASAQARELRASARAGAAQFAGARQALMLRVSDMFFAVLAARDWLAAIEAQESTARREQRAAQARFDAGRAKITDVREAQARADAAAVQAIDAGAQLAIATARFSELTGLDEAAVVPVRAGISPAAPHGSLDHWQALGEAASPIVIAYQHAADAATARADGSTWGAGVRVDATAGANTLRFPGRDDSFASVDRVTGYTAGLRLKMPLYTGGGAESQHRQAQAQARSARERLEAARRDVRLNVQRAWTGQSSSAAAITALRTALASARLQQQAAITGREVGIRTQSDVLSAQTHVIETERQLAEAIRTYENSRLSLYAAAGELDEQRLAEIDHDLAEPNDEVAMASSSLLLFVARCLASSAVAGQ